MPYAQEWNAMKTVDDFVRRRRISPAWTADFSADGRPSLTLMSLDGPPVGVALQPVSASGAWELVTWTQLTGQVLYRGKLAEIKTSPKLLFRATVAELGRLASSQRNNDPTAASVYLACHARLALATHDAKAAEESGQASVDLANETESQQVSILEHVADYFQADVPAANVEVVFDMGRGWLSAYDPGVLSGTARSGCVS
jgi:hypothetical protein